MSWEEYQSLLKGRNLTNNTVHKNNGLRTTSVGFCFFVEDPYKAIHWLGGCVNSEYCVTMDIPDKLLTESEGTYRDTEKTDVNDNFIQTIISAIFGTIPMKTLKEYCLQEYDISKVKILNVIKQDELYKKAYK